VRIKSGVYAGDLGLVEKIEANKKAIVRLIPRMQEIKDEKGNTRMKLVTKKEQGQS